MGSVMVLKFIFKIIYKLYMDSWIFAMKSKFTWLRKLLTLSQIVCLAIIKGNGVKFGFSKGVL